jgi:hypothetical protein
LAQGLHRRSHDHAAALGTRHRAADQQQVAHGIDFHNAQIFNGAVAYAHVARHALALEHAARSLALADRARRAVRHRISVGFHAAREIVALHGALEAFAYRGTGDIDDLARAEHVDFDFAAGRQCVAFPLAQSEFLRGITGSYIRLGEMAGEGLPDARCAAAANGDLNRTIAVGFIVFDLRDAIRQRLDDRHGHGYTGVGEYSGHAALAANQTNGHCQSSYSEGL